MMKVGIQLKDREYARVLVRGLAAEGRRFCFVLMNDGCREQDFDLILTDGACEGTRYVFLVSQPEETHIFEGPPYRIFRYQDAPTFVSQLLFIYYRETGRNLEFVEQSCCKPLIFTSISGGPATTALALSMAELLDKHFRCRCLYLNLCPVDESKRFVQGNGGKGLLTLLYYLDQEKDFPMTSFISKHLHVDHIDTNISNPYFDELHPLQLRRLLKKIDEMGTYRYLFLDIGNHLSRGNKQLLSLGTNVILVTEREDRIPDPFFKDFLKLLEQICDDDVIRQVTLEPVKSEENPLSMKRFQWEAGRMVKALVEGSEGAHT
ncbi:MAG: hypothetical protein IKK48_06205 [Firmicutes bacterium]|nr:hypothetical protein [Bacillota bacterium]